MYARLLVKQNQPSRAEPELKTALQLEPKLTEARVLLGTVLRAQGLVAESIRQLRQSLEENPKSAEALFQLGLALYASGDVNGAQESFEQAIALAPDFSDARVNLAAVVCPEEKRGRCARMLCGNTDRFCPGIRMRSRRSFASSALWHNREIAPRQSRSFPRHSSIILEAIRSTSRAASWPWKQATFPRRELSSRRPSVYSPKRLTTSSS